MKRSLVLLAMLMVAVTGVAFGEEAKPAATASPTHIMVTPNEVKWGPAPESLPAGALFAVVGGDPKAEGVLFTFRLKLPDGWRVPPHFHPADEHVTVISGTFNMGMGDTFDEKVAKALPAGGFAVMPKGQHHFAWAKGETILQIHAIGPWGITYVNPKDDPRTATAKR